jgi:hypothetical protein
MDLNSKSIVGNWCKQKFNVKIITQFTVVSSKNDFIHLDCLVIIDFEANLYEIIEFPLVIFDLKQNKIINSVQF